MTVQDQIALSDLLSDAHIKLDLAAKLLVDVENEHFGLNTAPQNFQLEYGVIQAKIQAVSNLLFDTCLLIDLITGENTPLTQYFKSEAVKLLSYHSLSNTDK